MPLPKGTRYGLLLLLTAGPFLVFLFLHLFGKNHFETDRYPLSLDEVSSHQWQPGSGGLLLIDSGSAGCSKAALQAQLNRFRIFTGDFGKTPSIFFLDPQKDAELSLAGRDWFTTKESVEVKSARGKGIKKLPVPPRALLFDSLKTLRGVYGLCDNKSMDSLMLEYRILQSP